MPYRDFFFWIHVLNATDAMLSVRADLLRQLGRQRIIYTG